MAPVPANPEIWSKELMREIAMDIGKEAVHHLETMYPEAIAACPKTMQLSLRNTIHNQIMSAIEFSDEDKIRARLAERKAFRRRQRAFYKNIRKNGIGGGA